MPISKLENPNGLFSTKAIVSLVAWYITSFLTLFMNKYTLSSLNAETFFFSTMQILISTILGFCNMYYPCQMGRRTSQLPSCSRKFCSNMFFVGITRFLVVFLGLISLEHVAVSFTEAVKSSAPVFTVVFSWTILGERNGLLVQLSLIPIVVGLALCSVYELSFTMIGFLAALGTNLAECMQFVLSKKSVVGSESVKISPAEFQFYSCLASIVFQLPAFFLFTDFNQVLDTSFLTFLWIILNGVMYHCQTMTAWVLMECVSPVTHSVCNTVKRGLAIWLCLIVYRNEITTLGTLGTLSLIIGVLLYNQARQVEAQQNARQNKLSISNVI